MAEAVCRSCGTAVPAGAAVCPSCDVPDPVVASETLGPTPERQTGSAMKSAAKAIGCLVLAGLVLAIALLVGVFDLFF